MIPRTIHQVWIGNPMPEQIARYCATWQAHHPGWEYRLWDEPAIAEFGLVNQDLYDRADTFAMAGRGNQVRSDIVRYEVLHRIGGVYVDADFEALRALDPLLEDVECFAGWEIEGRWVNMALSGSAPAHPFLTECIRRLPANIRRYDGRTGITSSTSLSGPRYLTPIWRSHRREVRIFPQKLFYPYDWRAVGTPAENGPWPDAYAVHHWGNRRNLKQQPGWDYAR